MAIISLISSNRTFSLKFLLASTGVLSMAVILKLSVPVIKEFAITEIPSIWSFVVSWLRPPYLYLVINCIIIIIVASSRFQSNVENESRSKPETAVLVQQELIKVPTDLRSDYAVVYGGVVLKNEPAEVRPEFEYDSKVEKVSDVHVYGHVEVSETNGTIPVNDSEEMNVSDDFVILKSSWTELNKDPTDYSFPSEKLPVSSRFGHRKAVKASSEGGKALGVSKPKRQDTLESTWKTITDGRPMPLTRHLRKSDTWETHGCHHNSSAGYQHDTHNQIQTLQKMTKYETFNDHSSSSSNKNSSMSPSPSSGKLKKEPSPSQDELNRRVEAFIKKFNEDMRLQRQESLNQYMEMINRGAH